MHKSSWAPALTATRSRDSWWITSSALLSRASVPLGLLEALDDPPALGGRQRPGLHQEHPVADPALVDLVVSLELAGTAQDLAVQRVLDPVLHDNDDGLVHLVADHGSLADLAEAALDVAHLILLTHATSSDGSAGMMPSSRSRKIV